MFLVNMIGGMLFVKVVVGRVMLHEHEHQLWEFSLPRNVAPRRGFRSVFDRGVLQLYFNFKNYNYRR